MQGPHPPQKKTAQKTKFGQKKKKKKTIGQSMDFFGGNLKVLGNP
jgi:hypothetical protein